MIVDLNEQWRCMVCDHTESADPLTVNPIVGEKISRDIYKSKFNQWTSIDTIVCPNCGSERWDPEDRKHLSKETEEESDDMDADELNRGVEETRVVDDNITQIGVRGIDRINIGPLTEKPIASQFEREAWLSSNSHDALVSDGEIWYHDDELVDLVRTLRIGL